MLHSLIKRLVRLQQKIDDFFYLWSHFRWMFEQRKVARPLGTTFSKVEGNYTVEYEVIGYFPGESLTEMVEEVSRKPHLRTWFSMERK